MENERLSRRQAARRRMEVESVVEILLNRREVRDVERSDDEGTVWRYSRLETNSNADSEKWTANESKTK